MATGHDAATRADIITIDNQFTESDAGGYADRRAIEEDEAGPICGEGGGRGG